MAFAQVLAGVGDNKLDIFGATPAALFTLTFGGADTYVTGGLSLTGAQFGLSRGIGGILCVGGNSASVVAEPYWNTQTQKLMLQEVNVGLASTPAPFQELPNATSIANFVYSLLVLALR